MGTGKRAFELKTFSRWAKGVLTDEQLCAAAKDVMAGHYEVDLGAGICKKRIAAGEQGKSGATRTLIAKKHQDAIFFLAGREKNEPGTDFTDKQVEAAKVVAKGLRAATQEKLMLLLDAGAIQEICNEKPKFQE